MKNSKLIIGGISGVVIVGALVVFFMSSGVGVNNFGNVAQLSLVQDHGALSCEAFNKLGVTKNGVFSIVASGRDGFNPLISSNLLTVTSQGVPIESFHVQLFVSCKGDLIDDSSAVTVTGTNNLLLCGDPSNSATKCFLSDERRFQSLNGIAQSTTQFNTFPLGSFALPDDEEVLVYQGNIRADDIERFFGLDADSIIFTSKMFPQFTFTFNHKTLGIIQVTHDALALGQLEQVYAQWNEIATNAPPPPDSDGDGINDTNDGCINEPETVNGFEDEDGCPDDLQCSEFQNPVDTNGDGFIDNCLDIIEVECPDGEFFFSGTNQCEIDDLNCTTDVDPVCEVDTNTTFSNACFANIGGAEEPIIAGMCPDEPIIDDVCDLNPDDPICDMGVPDVFFCTFLGQTNCTPTDSDNDGVTNSEDLCPNTEPNADIDADGCELPPELDLGGTDSSSGDGSLTTLPPVLTKEPTGLLNEQFCSDEGLLYQGERLGCTQRIVDPSVMIVIPEQIDQLFGIENLAFTDIIIFSVIGVVIVGIIIALMRRK